MSVIEQFPTFVFHAIHATLSIQYGSRSHWKKMRSLSLPPTTRVTGSPRDDTHHASKGVSVRGIGANRRETGSSSGCSYFSCAMYAELRAYRIQQMPQRRNDDRDTAVKAHGCRVLLVSIRSVLFAIAPKYFLLKFM